MLPAELDSELQRLALIIWFKYMVPGHCGWPGRCLMGACERS